MNRTRKIRALAFFLLGLGSMIQISCTWLNREQHDKIRLSGNIELTEVNIAFKISGKLIELAVKEGDPVKKDMVLGRLDPEQLNHQLARERAGLAVSESQLAQLNSAIQFQTETLEAETELRRAELNQAEARLRDLLAGSRTQEVRQAQAAVAAFRADHEQAKKDWERAQVLFKSDDISASQYDQFKTRLDSTAAALRQAEDRLALVIEGPRKEEIESARAQVARAKAALKLTEANRLELKRKEQEVETRRAEIERGRAQVALTNSQLQDATAKSPIDGVVLVKSAEVGEVLAPGASIVTVGDLNHPWLRGYINEKDLGRLKLGARVKVTTDSFPGKVYWGRLSFISSEAEFTPKQIQTSEERVKLVYRIKVDITNPQHELKLNMPADAEILLDETHGE